MYYVSILHRIPYTTVEYTTETYFIDENAANNWLIISSCQYEFHPYLCHKQQTEDQLHGLKIGVLCAD